jgi:hypothetical protein
VFLTSKPWFDARAMQQDLEKLAADIGAEFAGAATDIESYANGTIMLNVRFKKKLFILGFVGNRWGVDMVRDGEIGDTGLRILSADFGTGRADLLRLMRAP